MKLHHNILLLLLFVTVSPNLNAAKVRILNPDVLFLDGEIKKGDYRQLIDVVVNHGKIPSMMAITSPGGDVIEAMKIGRFARRNHMQIAAIQPCDSACTFIIFAAVKRVTSGKLGLHRPHYDPQYFSQLSGEAANKKYKELDGEVRKYLIEMNVPTLIIDKIMSIPSSNIEYIEISFYNNLAGSTSPAYNEWLAARCGSFTDRERQDFAYSRSLIMHNKYPDAELDPLASEMLDFHLEEARKLSPSYRESIYKKGMKANH